MLPESIPRDSVSHHDHDHDHDQPPAPALSAEADSALVAQVRAGNEEAFEQLLRRGHAAVEGRMRERSIREAVSPGHGDQHRLRR